MIPLIGTSLGSGMVFLMKNKLNNTLKKALLGFASGVMIAASVWSLLIPSIEIAKDHNIIAWVPSTIGFLLGIIFLLIIDNTHIKSKKLKVIKSKLGSSAMMIFAVTLHNIPEGMAVGVALAGAISNNSSITMAEAIVLSIGIGIQNFPEGAIISMPLRKKNNSKFKSFLYGVLSGIVEPIGGIITIILTSLVVPILPYLLSFAAGAMIYVVIKELTPESQIGKNSNYGTIGFALGFILMMILDVAL